MLGGMRHEKIRQFNLCHRDNYYFNYFNYCFRYSNVIFGLIMVTLWDEVTSQVAKEQAEKLQRLLSQKAKEQQANKWRTK